jgi:hypothetical protein
MRIENDGLSEAPTKPKIAKRRADEKIGVVEDIGVLEDYDEFNHEYEHE